MKYVLVIGVYMMSKLADPNDVVSFFYGDGAGAAVLAVDTKPGFLSAAYLADGSYHTYWGSLLRWNLRAGHRRVGGGGAHQRAVAPALSPRSKPRQLAQNRAPVGRSEAASPFRTSIWPSLPKCGCRRSSWSWKTWACP